MAASLTPIIETLTPEQVPTGGNGLWAGDIVLRALPDALARTKAGAVLLVLRSLVVVFVLWGVPSIP